MICPLVDGKKPITYKFREDERHMQNIASENAIEILGNETHWGRTYKDYNPQDGH